MIWKYFRSPDDQTPPYAFPADGSQDAFIPTGMVIMSDNEVREHIHRVSASDIAPVESERQWRDAELVKLVWLRDRHRDQLEIGAATTLTSEQFGVLLVYMQALRDWPQSPDFPATDHRPAPPAWIAEQTQ